MPRLLILGLLLYIAWRLLRNLIREKIRRELRRQERSSHEKRAAVEDMLMEDPVCHTLIPKRQAVRFRQDGTTYYFCSETCCDQFTGRKEGATE
jgi:YHS domain-containing protein